MTFNIAPAVGASYITSADTIQTVVTQVDFIFDVAADNQLDSLNFSALPPDLIFDPFPGCLEGTPATTGDFQITFSANNDKGRGSRQLFTLRDFATPSEAWKFENFGEDFTVPEISSDNSDPDQDGIINLLEYAFVLDPNKADTTLDIEVVIETVGEVQYVAIKFNQMM